jgi:hypothetical protein
MRKCTASYSPPNENIGRNKESLRSHSQAHTTAGTALWQPTTTTGRRFTYRQRAAAGAMRRGYAEAFFDFLRTATRAGWHISRRTDQQLKFAVALRAVVLVKRHKSHAASRCGDPLSSIYVCPVYGYAGMCPILPRFGAARNLGQRMKLCRHTAGKTLLQFHLLRRYIDCDRL